MASGSISPALRLNHAHLQALKAQGHIKSISNELYTLPAIAYPKLDLPIAERKCAACQSDFIDRPWEVPVILPCGHVAGSHCLETWLKLSTSCWKCNCTIPSIHTGDGIHRLPQGDVSSSPRRAAPSQAAITATMMSATMMSATTPLSLIPIAGPIKRDTWSIADVARAYSPIALSQANPRLQPPAPQLGAQTKSSEPKCSKNVKVINPKSQVKHSEQPTATSTTPGSWPRIHLQVVKIPLGEALHRFKSALCDCDTEARVLKAITIMETRAGVVSHVTMQDSTSGFTPINKSVVSTPEQRAVALARINEQYGFELTLVELEVALRLDNLVKGTETRLEDALRQWY